MTGVKSKKTLSEKYNEKKAASNKTTGNKRGRKPKKEITLFPVGWGKPKALKPSPKAEKKHFSKKQTYSMKPVQKKGISIFWIIVGISSFISLTAILTMFFIAKYL